MQPEQVQVELDHSKGGGGGGGAAALCKQVGGVPGNNWVYRMQSPGGIYSRSSV